jgi:hypothetical protein
MPSLITLTSKLKISVEWADIQCWHVHTTTPPLPV